MRNTLQLVFLFLMLIWAGNAGAQQSPQTKSPVKFTGAIGVTYEGYGLDVHPGSWTGIRPRRPYNQVRFNFNPVMQVGKHFTVPISFNFAAMASAVAGPYAGLLHQSVGQFLTNPANNFGINPKYKWAELQLGTQYLKYSDLSTGDIGIFGAGFDLKPKSYRFKFFIGTSQQGINYNAGPPLVTGAFKRAHWMFQFGKEKENKYKFALNVAKGRDKINSVATPPLTTHPQESFVTSLVSELYFKKGWYFKSEAAKAYFTRDLNLPVAGSYASFKPFITARTSTGTDWAANASIGKKSKNLDLSYTTKYIGAGFQTTGYPYLQADRWENTVNTRFNAWKNRINVVAGAGERVNNLSSTTLKAKQFIGNLNWSTQFTEKFSTNLTYNNFGFTSASGLNPYGIKNVSNDIGLSSTYTWDNKNRSNILTMSYTYSKYDERDVITGLTSTNNTHTALVTYIPVYFHSEIAPDFSVLYFNNSMPLVKNTLLTLSSGVSAPLLKKKMKLKGQLQYTIGKLNAHSANKNLIASANMDYKLTKKLTWNIFLNGNRFKYGNELTPPANLNGAGYLETTYRTGLNYKF